MIGSDSQGARARVLAFPNKTEQVKAETSCNSIFDAKAMTCGSGCCRCYVSVALVPVALHLG